MATSQNGYTANNLSLTTQWTIPGTQRVVRLRKGDPGWLLCDLAAWFDKHVEDIDAGQLDDWGYASRPIRGDSTTLSNHASGTAIDLNATRHPLGKVGTFTAKQAAAIRSRLKVYDGCIRWGGDYSGRKDEMHFEINASPEACTRIANKLRADDGARQQEDDMALTADEQKQLDAIQKNAYAIKTAMGKDGHITKKLERIEAALDALAKNAGVDLGN